MKKNKPTFFIVGAPRCGTTAMYKYLKAHPDIFMTSYKEPHHFSKDITPTPWMKRYRKRDNYLSLFNNVQYEKEIGECSVFYLFSKVAAKNIKKFNKNAKIIIMLRSPIEVMYSLYHLVYFGGGEDVDTFEKALELGSLRKKGKKIPKKTTHLVKEGYCYKDTVRFYEQVKRYYKEFPKDRVKIILFKDLLNSPKNVYKGVLEFLEVNTNFTPEFKRVNPNKTFKSNKIQKVLFFLASRFSFVGNDIFSLLRPFYKKIENINLKEAKRSKMDIRLERKLKSEFLPEVRKLSKLIKQDVTYWCKWDD